MSYKPDESAMMAYLYGEMDGEEKEKFEQYLLQHASARIELEKLQVVRKVMSTVSDKEVIAPPIFIGETKQRFMWNAPYLKTIASIAASLLLVMVVGKITDTRIQYVHHELKLSFGEVGETPAVQPVTTASLSPEQVQEMINASLMQSNSAMQASFKESQQKLDASIQKNLAMNSGKINTLVHEASAASQEQIQSYVSGLQRDNIKLVKDYFQLTSTDQKKYIEELLVDFAKYMKQQQTNDLQVVQTRLNSLEKNTDMFKEETEQILSSIITNVKGTNPTKGVSN
jgi:hypothetical protein